VSENKPRGLLAALGGAKFKFGPDTPSLLAVPGRWTLVPEEAETEYLVGLVEGRYDSMNAGDDDLVQRDLKQARAELERRGVPVPKKP
jgi:hypothetical protein